MTEREKLADGIQYLKDVALEFSDYDLAKRIQKTQDALRRTPSPIADGRIAREALENQIEIMGALSLLLRYAAPNLVGKAGELDRQRDDLLQRHIATQRALALPDQRVSETEEQIEERLAKQDASENLRLLDYIADKIGLPHDIDITRENFNAWFNGSDQHVSGWQDIGTSVGITEADIATARGFVIEKPSTSYIQRKMGISYNRATRLMELLEAEGTISKSNSAGKRTVLAQPLPLPPEQRGSKGDDSG